jgi:hypothetical protein
MGIVFTIHSLFGERVLPVLIVLVAVWLTVAWRPGQEAPRAARLFPVLVDIQATLGLIYWIFGLVGGNGAYLSFPFILHPLFGILSAGIAHMAVRPSGPFAALGRWAPLAALAVLLVLVVANIVLGRASV